MSYPGCILSSFIFLPEIVQRLNAMKLKGAHCWEVWVLGPVLRLNLPPSLQQHVMTHEKNFTV